MFASSTSSLMATAAVKWVSSLGGELGLSFQDSKTIWPTTRLEFLGLEIDSDEMKA